VWQSVTYSGEQFASLLDTDRLVDRLQRLVRTPSENPPGEEKAAADLVHEMCDELDLKVAEYEAEKDRPSVVARWESGDGPTLTYCSHIDVVPVGDENLWERGPFSGDIIDGHLHGRGSADAKGPIAAALEAVSLLRGAGVQLHGTLELALVADEETMGFQGAGYLVEEGLVKPDVAIVGEPTSLRLVRAQRGANWFRITTRGLAGHGSAPERGVSAIRHMSEIVLRLDETLPDVEHELLGGPSLSVGTIKGGEKVNIIPAGCVIEVDRRSIPQESPEDVRASIDRAIDLARERFPDLDATVELAFGAHPFEIPADSPLVTSMTEALTEANGTPAEIIGFRGASDARFLADTGAEVVVCGPGDIAVAHTAHESVSLDEVAKCAVAYALGFAKLLGAS
jgi:acetylornithine deacetylase/succinyl-diaminopimelate desuccinylase family protein